MYVYKVSILPVYDFSIFILKLIRKRCIFCFFPHFILKQSEINTVQATNKISNSLNTQENQKHNNTYRFYFYFSVENYNVLIWVSIMVICGNGW